MSFSSDVKNEIISNPLSNSCCRRSLIYGFLQMGRAFSVSSISLQTEYESAAVFYAAGIGTLDVTAVIRPQKNGYRVSVENAEDREKILTVYGHTINEFNMRLNRGNFECEDCMAVYLRGAFLAGGAITDPQSGYHFELNVPYYHLSKDILSLMRELGLPAKYTCRKGNHVIYLKGSEQIEDCLALMGAVRSALDMMNIQMVKDIRNNANRVSNCENANIDKTVSAAAAQVEAIRRIMESGKWGMLPPELQELAALRLENPELSLRELSTELSEPLSRSGVNHRIKRLLDFADNKLNR